MNDKQQIVPGITVTASGQAVVDPALTDLLIDLAIQLEERTSLPVDVQHVVAAIVLAVRSGQLDAKVALRSDDPQLSEILADQLKPIFEKFQGKLGVDD
jgi:hypothetical protein